MARLSILGLYNWDNTIFDDMVIPEGLDKEIIVNNILMDCSELEILYSNSDFMKFAIKTWSQKESPIWSKLLETTQYEYNPIWNYDGSDTETIIREGNASNHNESIQSVKGFNSDQWAQHEKVDSDDNGSSSETITTQRTKGGNQGTTTTQSMIMEEREVVQFNIYSHIIESFKNKFCLLIY